MRARVLGLCAQALAVVCGCLLALVLALNLTLFREGYYLHRLEESECLQTVYGNVILAGHTVARTVGLRENILDELIDEEDVRTAVFRRADEIWHGSTTQPDSPYSDVVAFLQDKVTWESGQMWDAEDTALYERVQTACEDSWRGNAVPPMSNLLNMLMQYRQIAWILVVVLGVLLVVCLWLQVPLQRHWWQLGNAFWRMGTSLALGGILVGVAINLSGWKNWMPATDPAYKLYYSWLRGLAPSVAACGLVLAALLWLVALYPYRMVYCSMAQDEKEGHK